jgi:hypothetical protein
MVFTTVNIYDDFSPETSCKEQLNWFTKKINNLFAGSSLTFLTLLMFVDYNRQIWNPFQWKASHKYEINYREMGG